MSDVTDVSHPKGNLGQVSRCRLGLSSDNDGYWLASGEIKKWFTGYGY